MVPNRIEVTPSDFQALSPDRLDELRKRYGLEIEICSSSEAIGEILKELGREIAGDAGHERGFDRTDPGYSRAWDKEVWLEFSREVINPAELVRRLRQELGPR